MDSQPFKCVITPNVRTIKLRSSKCHAKFVPFTPAIESFSVGPDGKPDGQQSIIIHGKTVFTRAK